MATKSLTRWQLVSGGLTLLAYRTLFSSLPVVAQSSTPSQPSPSPAFTPAQTNSTADFCPQAQYSPSQNQVRREAPTGTIQVRGYTRLSDAEVTQEIDQAIAASQGRSLSLEKLAEAVVDRLNLLYISKGYITSSVAPERTPIENGVGLLATEGYIGTIKVEGRQRLSLAYICRRAQLGITFPVQKDRLEEQLRLLRTDPLFTNVEASLGAVTGARLGESILSLRVIESKAFNGSLGADNYSPPSVGSERLGGAISYRNLTGLGDAINASYYRSTTGGSNSLDFNYRIPVNPMNGSILLRTALSRNKITDPQFDELNIRANNNLYEITYRQPLIRLVEKEFALSLGFSAENGQTFLFQDTPFPFGIGPDAEGNSRTRILRFGQEYVKRDPSGAWGLRSQFSFGLNIWGATKNPDPIPDGQFFSWLGQAQRVQRINDNNLLIIQADVQLTFNSLLPAQQYILGGGQSVRGFRQNARSGDNGFRFSIEDRIAIVRDKNGLPIVQLAPFFDAGAVWNKSGNPNLLPDQTFLAGTGLGIIYEPLRGFVIRLDYARPLVELRDRGNNAQDEGFYFSVGITL